MTNPENTEKAAALLNAQGFRFEPAPFVDGAMRLTEEPFPLGSSLAAFFGLIYIQDRSSMLPPAALRPPKGAVVLDMCASPGSKTSQLASFVGHEGMVLGNEPSPPRLAVLRQNLCRMMLTQAVTSCYSGESLPLPDASFEYILLDPPCSGWGTEERNPNVTKMWTEEKTLPLIRLQRSLLREAERLLRPGGRMVYSTCTTHVKENEEQLQYAFRDLGLLPDPLPMPDGYTLEKPLLGCEGVWRLSTIAGENQGFFIAGLRKAAAGLPEPSPMPGSCGTALTSRQYKACGFLPGDLPGGRPAVFGTSLHFVPDHAGHLPKDFRWQGMYMGKATASGELTPAPFVRAGSDLPRLETEGEEGIRLITGLLSGQSFIGDIREKSALLVWEGMPLCRLRVKNKRLFYSER
ncbi:MAG: RsmB/NOP family class I SAM-dependent RNA methyltransferase [Mailhella sp.]|nr:RsmB/NOP family class I SAM-dependent RNA methyltransferase [Mailhella sp.]